MQFPFAKIHTPQNQTYRFLDDGSSPYMVHRFNTPINPQVAPLPPSPKPISSSLASTSTLPPSSLPHPLLISHSSLPVVLLLGVNMGFISLRSLSTFLHQCLNLLYLVILCLLFVTRIGKWLWMMNIMILLKIRRGSWCPTLQMLTSFDLCEFLLIKKNLMVHLRGIKLIL